MNRSKSAARLRLEEKATVKDLTDALDDNLQQPPSVIEITKQNNPPLPRRALKMLAWLVLLAGIALAVLPAIGQGWMLFFFGLSYYFWQLFNGLAVVVGMLIVLGAIYVLVFK